METKTNISHRRLNVGSDSTDDKCGDDGDDYKFFENELNKLKRENQRLRMLGRGDKGDVEVIFFFIFLCTNISIFFEVNEKCECIIVYTLGA